MAVILFDLIYFGPALFKAILVGAAPLPSKKLLVHGESNCVSLWVLGFGVVTALGGKAVKVSAFGQVAALSSVYLYAAGGADCAS